MLEEILEEIAHGVPLRPRDAIARTHETVAARRAVCARDWRLALVCGGCCAGCERGARLGYGWGCRGARDGAVRGLCVPVVPGARSRAVLASVGLVSLGRGLSHPSCYPFSRCWVVEGHLDDTLAFVLYPVPRPLVRAPFYHLAVIVGLRCLWCWQCPRWVPRYPGRHLDVVSHTVCLLSRPGLLRSRGGGRGEGSVLEQLTRRPSRVLFLVQPVPCLLQPRLIRLGLVLGLAVSPPVLGGCPPVRLTLRVEVAQKLVGLLAVLCRPVRRAPRPRLLIVVGVSSLVGVFILRVGLPRTLIPGVWGQLLATVIGCPLMRECVSAEGAVELRRWGPVRAAG